MQIIFDGRTKVAFNYVPNKPCDYDECLEIEEVDEYDLLFKHVGWKGRLNCEVENGPLKGYKISLFPAQSNTFIRDSVKGRLKCTLRYCKMGVALGFNFA
jgi:hypothetical protein